jgi:hypothetical protein
LTQLADKGPIVVDDLRRIADAETGGRHPMNILLWVLQVLAALLYGASGVMKVFIFEKINKGVPSFGALPRGTWMALGPRTHLHGRTDRPPVPSTGIRRSR